MTLWTFPDHHERYRRHLLPNTQILASGYKALICSIQKYDKAAYATLLRFEFNIKVFLLSQGNYKLSNEFSHCHYADHPVIF